MKTRFPVGTAIAILAISLVVAPALASSAGKARILQPDGSRPLMDGGSNTPYFVSLPIGAACSGDTAHAGYRVWSYLAPDGVPLKSLDFTGTLPKPGFAFVANGRVFGPQNTAVGSGEILGIPNDFVFHRLHPSDLFKGHQSTSTWNSGIACALNGAMDRYWNVQIIFQRSDSDPGGFVWHVSQSGATHARRSWTGPLVAVLAIAAGFALFVTDRARRRANRPVAHARPQPPNEEAAIS